MSDVGTVQTSRNVVQYITEHVDCMAKAIYYEARGEGIRGMAAVGHVIVNRTKSERYPDDICSVIYQKHQFSWTKNPPKIVDQSLLAKAYDVAMRVLRGEIKDPTKGSVNFHATSIDPGWNKKPKVIIGNHIFY